MQIVFLFLVLAVAAQAQFFGHGAVPALLYPFAYGYHSYIDIQYPPWKSSARPASAMLAPDWPPATSVTVSTTRLAAMLTSTRKTRKSVSPTPPTPEASASDPTTCPLLPLSTC